MYAEKISDAIPAIRRVLVGVTKNVFDFVPPPGSVVSPAVIIDRNDMSFDASEVRVPVRIYVAASRHGGVHDAQLVFDEVLDAVEGALADDSARVEGGGAYMESADTWVADLTVTVSRI